MDFYDLIRMFIVSLEIALVEPIVADAAFHVFILKMLKKIVNPRWLGIRGSVKVKIVVWFADVF